MPDLSRTERASEALGEITKRRDALHDEAFQRSGYGTFTVEFGERMANELADLNNALGKFCEEFAPSIKEVATELGNRLLTVSDYRD